MTAGEGAPAGPPTLRTARLRLRALRPADLPAYQEMFADPALTWFWHHPPDSPQRVTEMVQRRLAADVPTGMGFWTVEYGGRIVGTAHLRPSPELPARLPETGWYVSVGEQGRGLGAETVAAVLRHAFDGLGLPAVWALVREDNLTSLALARRVGFLDVGGGEHYGGPHRVHVALRPG